MKKEDEHVAISWDGDLGRLIDEFGNTVRAGYKVCLPLFIEELKQRIVADVASKEKNQTRAAEALSMNRGTYRKYLKRGAEL